MKVITSVFLIGIALSANAQYDSTEKCMMPMLTHSIGGSFQKFDGMNSRVARFPQFEQLKDYTATLGLGWLKEKKRVVSSGNLALGSSMSGDRDKKSSTIRYYGITADIGYDVIKSERVMLYPFAGLGVQHYQAVFYKDNSAVDFNNILESPAVKNSISSVKFSNSFFVYRAGLGLAVSSPKCPGSSIGLQAGYTGSFKNHAWKSSEDQALANAPVDKISQVFASLVFISTPKFMNRK